MSDRCRGIARARGAVLVTGLIILAVMTVVGIGSMRSTILEERMAGNLKDQAGAFQATEAGIQAALTAIESRALPPANDAWGNGSIGDACRVTDRDDDMPCVRLQGVLDDWRGADAPTLGVGISQFGGAILLDLSAAHQPHVVIESRYSPPLDFEAAAQGRGIHYYTASALGMGASGQSETILQTTIGKVYAW